VSVDDWEIRQAEANVLVLGIYGTSAFMRSSFGTIDMIAEVAAFGIRDNAVVPIR
jgi:hypothetical protein